MKRVVVALLAAGLLTGCATALPAAPLSTVSPASSSAVPLSPSSAGPLSPSSAAPEPAACVDSLVIEGGGVDAAMGQRGMVVTATNCAAAPVTLTGYPKIWVTGPAGESILAEPGGNWVQDPGPLPVTLTEGESACVVITWRNTVTSGDAVSAEEYSLVPVPGAEVRMLTELIDLGTTGQWFTTAWYTGQLPELTGPC